MVLRLAVAILVSSFALLVAACGGGADDGETPSATTTPAGPTPAGDIRERDLEGDPAVVEVLGETGGVFAQEDVLYADLTQDGIEEAIVPIASGGTAGNLAFLVLTPVEDGTAVLVREQPPNAFALTVIGGKLVQTEAVRGQDDPECCPSLLRRTTYAWDGSVIFVEDVETFANPDGVVKPTPQPGR